MPYPALRKLHIYLLTFFIFFPVISLSLQAGEIENLYESKVLISIAQDESDEKVYRKKLLNKALLKVLYKVTGSKAYLKSPDLKSILSESELLVQKFSFESEKTSDLTQSVDKVENNKTPLEKKNEDSLAKTVEDSLAKTVEDSLAKTVEDSLAKTVEDSLEGKAEGSLEKKVEDSLVETVEDSLEGKAEGSLEKKVEDSLEGKAEGSLVETVEDSLEGKAEGSLSLEEEQELQKSWFWARFSKKATDELLKKHHLTVWESLRPDTLLWLSIEKNRKREIFSATTDPSIIKLLNSTAQTRGINLNFPFGDLEDREKLSMTDLWANYSQAIKAASLKYNSQAILAVRAYKEPSGLWVVKWSLYVLDKIESWSNKGEDLGIVLMQGINTLADKLAHLFALRSDSLNQNVSIIQVNNVTNFSGFLEVQNYFKQISALQSNQLIQVKGDSLIFKAYYLGDEKHLAQSLALGDVLQKVENTTDSIETSNNQSTEYVSVILDKPEQGKKNNLTKLENTMETPLPAVQNIQLDLEFWLAR